MNTRGGAKAAAAAEKEKGSAKTKRAAKGKAKETAGAKTKATAKGKAKATKGGKAKAGSSDKSKKGDDGSPSTALTTTVWTPTPAGAAALTVRRWAMHWWVRAAAP